MVSRVDHRRNTLLKLSEAAVEAFSDDGPQVTIAEIARRAGLSRRTVFRYVDSKEELAFIHPLLWFDVFDDALDELGREALIADLAGSLRTASRAIAIYIDADPGPPRRAFELVAVTPDLARGFTAVYQRWINRIAVEVLNSSDDVTSPHAQFRARIIGSAVMGMVDAVVRQWVFSSPETKFVDLYDEGFDLLEPLLATK